MGLPPISCKYFRTPPTSYHLGGTGRYASLVARTRYNPQFLLRALPAKDRPHRLEHDQQIEPQGHVFDVVQIELQLFAGLSQRRSVSITHLRPSRQSRANHMTQVEVGNLLGEPR